MFKLIAAGLGFYAYGFLGAIIGYMVGGAIDRNIAYGSGAINPLTGKQREQLFAETLFMLLGTMAKADGHISQEEVDQTEQLIKEHQMTAEGRTKAIDLFKKGSASDFDYKAQVTKFMAVCGKTHDLKQMLLVYLIVMAMSDGNIDQSEEKLLQNIAQELGFNAQVFRQIMASVISQSHFSGADGQKQASPSMLADAYKALGVTKDDTDKDIKRAYRKLMSQYHPDKLMGQGLPKDMIDVGTKKAQEIQVAYDLIQESRQ